jgi:hypothetical protein
LLRLTDRDEGDADSVKFGTAGAVTANVTVVECTGVPLGPVPVIVTVELPVGVDDEVVTVIVDEPDVTEAGAKVTDAPLGNPLALSTTEPLNPFDGVTVTV